jgi:hypothetical protein
MRARQQQRDAAPARATTSIRNAISASAAPLQDAAAGSRPVDSCHLPTAAVAATAEYAQQLQGKDSRAAGSPGGPAAAGAVAGGLASADISSGNAVCSSDTSNAGADSDDNSSSRSASTAGDTTSSSGATPGDSSSSSSSVRVRRRGGTRSGRLSYRMLVSYDGTAYSGWQLQSLAQARTIQGQIERALTTVLREDRDTICVCAAGRTDAGVHAVGQVRAM